MQLQAWTHSLYHQLHPPPPPTFSPTQHLPLHSSLVSLGWQLTATRAVPTNHRSESSVFVENLVSDISLYVMIIQGFPGRATMFVTLPSKSTHTDTFDGLIFKFYRLLFLISKDHLTSILMTPTSSSSGNWFKGYWELTVTANKSPTLEKPACEILVMCTTVLELLVVLQHLVCSNGYFYDSYESNVSRRRSNWSTHLTDKTKKSVTKAPNSDPPKTQLNSKFLTGTS